MSTVLLYRALKKVSAVFTTAVHSTLSFRRLLLAVSCLFLSAAGYNAFSFSIKTVCELFCLAFKLLNSF